MADAVPPPTAGTSLADAPCTVRCWSCGQWFGSPEDFGPEAEYTCAKCWAKIESVDRSVDLPPPNRIPWWHRTVSAVVLAACTVTFAGLCAGLSWLVLVVFLGGCAFVATPNGKGGVFGIGFGDTSELPSVPNVADVAPQAGGIIGGIFGGPGGAAIGTGIGGVIASVFGAVALKQSKKRGQAEAKAAHLEGRESGYEDYERDTTVRVVPPPAPVLVASASPAPIVQPSVQPIAGITPPGSPAGTTPSVPVVELKAAPKRKGKA